MNDHSRKGKKILLVNQRAPEGCGRSYYLPLGLMYLASACLKMEFDVTLLDFNIYVPYKQNNPNEFCNNLLIEKVMEIKPDIVLLGCLFSGQFDQALSASQTIKKISPRIRTILGGIHATSYPTEILQNCPTIDHIVLGEGEKTIERFLRKYLTDDEDFSDLDGFAYRNDSGTVIVNKKLLYIENLDDIYFPAYNLVDMKDYYIDSSSWHNPKKFHINASVPLITSRGCPMKCSFCPMSQVMGIKYRQRSVENVFQEIHFLYTKHGHTYFSFMDDNLTLNRDFILNLCNLIIENHLDIQFDTPNGISVNSLDDEVIDALVKAGLVRVALAIESGSPFIRKIMGKSISQQKIFNVVESFKRHPSVFIRAFFIMGMPEDTNETLTETYEMIKKIDVHSSEVANLIAFPGTKLFNQAYKDKLFFDEIHLDNMWKSTFILSKRDYFMIKPYDLTLDDLRKWRFKFNLLSNPSEKPMSQGELNS